jgi:hypothetical protein
VLLDRRDVLAWVQGEILKPVVPAMRRSTLRAGAPVQRLGRQPGQAVTAARPGGRAHFDLSVAALRERRAAKVEPAS